MKKLLRLIVVTLACQASIAQAFWGDGWLRVYWCADSIKAMRCADCRLEESLKLRFFVSERDQTVLQQGQIGGVTEQPVNEGLCRVGNKKNWSCKSAGMDDSGMADGIYFSGTVCAK